MYSSASPSRYPYAAPPDHARQPDSCDNTGVEQQELLQQCLYPRHRRFHFAAGWLRMPFWLSVLAIGVGKALRYAAILYALL